MMTLDTVDNSCCDVTRCRVARRLLRCSAEMMSVQDAVMMSVQDAVIIFSQNDHRVSPVWRTSEGLSSRSEPVLWTRPVRAEPTTAVHAASKTGRTAHSTQKM